MATVILKPTEACNARCIYCVVYKKPRRPVTMPLETLELFFSRVNEFLRERPEEQMEIVWHGGEPLLLGVDYFTRALQFQEKHCPQTYSRIRHSLQSNLTLFSREFTSVFKQLEITSLGTSYEPIENLRGLGKNRDSRLYNRRFMEAIGLVEDEGFSWGVIYVVNQLSLTRPLELFQFFANLLPKGNFMFNPVLIHDPRLQHLKIIPEEYADFLGAIFPAWWRQREELPQVEPFAGLIRNLQGETRSLICYDSGACVNSHLGLLPDGSLSLCGRSGDWGMLSFGSIFDKSFSQVMADPQRDLLRQRRAALRETDCQGCRFWPICHGGCPLEAWAATGSFLRKSDWCNAKKALIEKYVEPALNADSTRAAEAPPQPESHGQYHQAARQSRTEKIKAAPAMGSEGSLTWINPRGGLGDALMLSGVLKQVVEQDPSRKFNLVTRAQFGPLLDGHPALAQTGYPPPGAKFIGTNYWDQEDYHLPGQRAYQMLARIFGLETPVEERLYIPGEIKDDPVLMGLIPWQSRHILICPGSGSPRKRMAVEKWELLVARLNQDRLGIVQAGTMKDRYVRGAYSLLGLTTPRQLISLLRRFDVIVTGDNFIMHAAHLCGVPAVVLWGPTDYRVTGYAGQIHLKAGLDCEYFGRRLGGGDPDHQECPRGEARCMNGLKTEDIYLAVQRLL